MNGTDPDVSYRALVFGGYARSNRAGASDVELSSAWGSAVRAHLRGWLPADRSASILDIGCGAGNFLSLAQKLGYEDVTGIDVSPEQVARAQKNCVGAQVILGQAIDVLRLSPSRYAVITAFDVIEHFNKTELMKLFAAVFGALAPGGYFILQTPNPESPWGMKVRYGDLTHELALSPTCLQWTLGLFGFAEIDVRETGPYVHGVRSLVRFVLWQGVRLCLKLWNVAETGDQGSGVYTRVFVARARKPGNAE